MYFNPMQPDGFTMFVMQSGEYTDKILENADRYLREGLPAEAAIRTAMYWERVDESYLTDPDIDRIQDWLEENM